MIPTTFIIRAFLKDGALTSTVHLKCVGGMPFAPPVGMPVCPMFGDQYRSVVLARWSVQHGLEVFLEAEESIDIDMLTSTLKWRYTMT